MLDRPKSYTDPTATRVLVTGGAGFLGSHLCERLLAEGCDVLCADNLYSGTKYNITHNAFVVGLMCK